MSLLSDVVVTEQVPTISFNTGSLFDLATGTYVPGVDGKWYLSGGLTQHINAFVGPNGAFKSTFACAMIMRAANICYDAEVLINDTENSLDKDKHRAMMMGEELTHDDIVNRVLWVSGANYTLDSMYKLIQSICEKKNASKKEYLVKSPFLDEKTGKALEIWKPTYIFIDSLTELISEAEDDMLNGAKMKNLSDANTAMMLDGNKKTLFIRAMKTLCMRYGLVLVVTGHFDKVMQMDMYNPTPKDTTFSKQDWKTKGVGSKLKFNASLYVRTSTTPLLDSNKEPLYGVGSGPVKDVMEIDIVIERSKTTSAGNVLPFVATQTSGIMNAVTNYNYLRTNEYDGLTGNKQKQQVGLLPEVTISRNTIRELSSSKYELRRALEIAAQYCYIRNNWMTNNLPVDFSKPATEFFNMLTSDKNRGLVNDILNTRGYWTYCKDERKYMDLFEIMTLAGLKK